MGTAYYDQAWAVGDSHEREAAARAEEERIRRLVEESVEEQADERVRHADFYEGAVERLPLKVAVASTSKASGAASAAAAASNPCRALVAVDERQDERQAAVMAVVPGRCVRGVFDVFSFVMCLVVVVVQFGLIDYYYLSVLNDNVWYAWLGADTFVIVCLLWPFVTAFKSNQNAMEEMCSVDAKVRYAWIGWLAYSAVLVGKVATCFRLFHEKIPAGATDNHDKLFDDLLFKLGLSLSALVFLFLLDAHHYTPLRSPRQTYVAYLATAVCLDLLDAISFIDLLWQAVTDSWKLALWLELVVLGVACANFVMPVFALLRLRFGSHLPKSFFVSDKVWAFLYVLLVNGPLLGLRVYLWILLELHPSGRRYDPGLFAVKNIAMIYIAKRELWTRLQYWRQKRHALGSHGALTAEAHDEE